MKAYVPMYIQYKGQLVLIVQSSDTCTCTCVQDPHKELVNQNVLIVRGSLSDTASHFSIAPEKASSLLGECRAKLFAERLKRPKPHRDEKILSAWNGKFINMLACQQHLVK